MPRCQTELDNSRAMAADIGEGLFDFLFFFLPIISLFFFPLSQRELDTD